MAHNTPEQPVSKPSKAELLAAYGKTVADVIAPGLRILFCGINPGLYTAAIGHHFGRPGNRFWKGLWQGGLTPRLLSPYEERELLPLGYGITNLVARATALASELTHDELVAGRDVLEDKVRTYRPGCVAVLGLGAYRLAFGAPRAGLGRQERLLEGSALWVLPNPSGLNGHYSLEKMGELFGELRRSAEGR